jgi:NTE family protein
VTDPGFDSDFEIVALSGTSGGALCCLLAWYGLLAHPRGQHDRGARTAQLLSAFWDANSAREWWDLLFVNPFTVGVHRRQDAGWIGQFPPPGWTPLWIPDLVRRRLRQLIERQVTFDDVPDLLRRHPHHPTLLVGAVDILSGEFAVFQEACPDPDWRRTKEDPVPSAVSIDPVLASAAIPPLMRAMPVGSGQYWDGLYAHNPPIRDLVAPEPDQRPDEIWVIQIDPQKARREPTGLGGIVDRRFELASNLSLNAEIHWIKQINQWINEGTLDAQRFKQIRIARIRMGDALEDRLDLASKVDRDPRYLGGLMTDGRRQASVFLRHRSDPHADFWEPLYPHRYQPRAPTSAGAPASI